MKHHKFTESERRQLESNPNIAMVLNSNVEYTSAFKAYALARFAEGYSPKHVFEQAGIPDWLNITAYARKSISRWLVQKRTKNARKPGRPRLENEKSIDEMSIEELRAKVKYMEAVIDFQKKIRAL